MAKIKAVKQIASEDINEKIDSGIKQLQSGNWSKAEACFQQVLQWQPENPDVWHLLGMIAAQQKEYPTAIERIQRAIKLKSTEPNFHSDLGKAYLEQGQFKLASECYQQALHLRPNDADTYKKLGTLYKKQENLPEALQCYQKAIQLRPDYAEAYISLGNIFKLQGKLTEAIQSYQQALKFNPNFFEAYNNLGNILGEQGKLTEAIQAYQKALQLNPNYAEAYYKLGNAFRNQGKLTEAIQSYQQALIADPLYVTAHSHLLLLMNCCNDEPLAIYAEHRKWNDRYAAPLAKTIQPHDNECNPERRLRIGYVSSDFWDHSVAYFFESLLAVHNHSNFEIICYANNKKTDATTERLRHLADDWREIYALNDEQIAEQIRQDKIDILIDLSGHTDGNQLLVFARKPAPVQVTYIGYPNSTGLDTMDYRIVDAWTDPEGQTEHLHSEELVRLSDGFLCYKPSPDAPEVSPSPVLKSTQITFGSFNHLAKISPQTIGYWAAILKAVPKSRILLKFPLPVDSSLREYLNGLFKQHDIECDRVELVGGLPDKQQHLALYKRVDIALDTFPYNGTTTSCETLWMGVPVITLAGQTHVSRVGVSLLSSLDLEDLIAQSPEAYIQKAVELANDRERLQELRATLRDRMAAAPLTNANLIIQSLENAYRMMWRNWCLKDPNKSTQLENRLNLGIEHQQAGRLQLAESCYQQVLQRQPNHPDAWHLLGVIAAQQQQYPIAIERINRAIELKPTEATFYINLGNVYLEQNQFQPACASYHKALQLQPNEADTRKKLAIACEKLLDLGIKHHQARRLAEAETCYQQVLEYQPDRADGWHLWGAIAYEGKEYEIAIERVNRAIELNPKVANFYNHLGNIYQEQRRFAEAIEVYEKGIQLQPDYAPTYAVVGIAYEELDRLGKAIWYYQKAVQLQPSDGDTLCRLGRLLKRQGCVHEAIECYRSALFHNPDHIIVNLNLLTSLHYSPNSEPSKIYTEYRKWAERHTTPLAKFIKPLGNDRNPERRLRIGYVSGDFYIHAVAFFLEPLLAAHNHNNFEIICYANNQNKDTTTKRLQKYADSWREIHALNDEEVADLIRQDGIDILVDLSGHTNNNRLPVFAQKPAPIQVTYLGYPNTTGLDTMDYRLTDAWADPIGKTEHLHTEELVRLPHGFLCYQPFLNAPEVSSLPVLTSQQITFGSFNKLAKVNPELIGYWARILKAVPDSRLLIKSKPLMDTDTCDYVHQQFHQHGIATERIELLGWVANKSQHLDLYNRVDIALDTFPYNGTTTTCEAMWMGVPVITLAGQTHVSRVGVSLLSSVGLEALIAESSEEYIQKAIALANDRERLQELRATLRDRMAAAPLTNANLIIQSLENAYRMMWRNWCLKDPNKSTQLENRLNLGIEHQQAGRLQLAESCYQQVLQRQPNHPDAWHLLGVIAAQQQQYPIAIERINRAIELKPTEATFYINLGNVYLEQNQFQPACASYHKALQLQPNEADTRKKLAIACEKLLDLGIKHHQARRLAEAETCYQQVLEYQPDRADGWHLWGVIAYEGKEYEIAIERINRAIELNSIVPSFHTHLGNVFQKQGKLEEAIQAHQKALEINPNYADAYYNLGHTLEKQGKLNEAIKAYQRTVELKPDFADAHNNLGNALKEQGKLAEAIASYQRALQIDPNCEVTQSNLVSSLHYSSEYQPSEIYAEHRKWDKLYAAPFTTAIQTYNKNAPEETLPEYNPDRRLRIGYVSGDFKTHSVTYFFEPLLVARDRRNFEIICYANNKKADATTQRLRQLADGWREIAALKDEQVAELVHQDRIDILIDLSGHTANNRLLVFARKPAPIQASYIGYPDTTGLSTIDYRFTDVWADPEGQTEHLHTEELVRLPHGFLCYQPPVDAPQVSSPPVLETGQITFGSFNNLAKISPKLIDYWAEILRVVPNSRLLLKSKSLVDPSTQEYVQGLFQQQGIDSNRLELVGRLPDKSQHLAFYNQVDIALDTFPYHGTTTTCEAMWMGVPVITLAGQTHVSRVGVSLLSSVSLEELIAQSPEEYIQKAVALAKNRAQLQELRATLRDRMQAAPLTNAKLITQSLEDAYRTMWQRWCSQGKSAEAALVKILSTNPDQLDTELDLGIEYCQSAKFQEAEACFQKVLKMKPDNAEAWHLLGVIAAHQHNYQIAIERIEKAIKLKPNEAIFYTNFGNVYLAQEDFQQAIACYQKALQIQPNNADAYKNLGVAHQKQGNFTQALQYYQKVLQIQPGNAEAYINLGNVYHRQGRQTEAINYYQKAIQLQPNNAIAQSNLATTLHYSNDYEPSAIYSAHRKWANSYAQPLAASIPSHSNDPNPERCLRIGYVSGDFYLHSVAFFFEPLLAAHNHQDFQIICYANNKKTDATTQRLQSLADGWHEIHSLNDEQVAELIRRDGIDILVDLSGYTKGNRKLVFARKPAPVQVTYLGYPNTTGLDTIDYRLTDAWTDPEGQTEHLHTEQLVRLPHGFLCYQPPIECPEVGSLPVLTNQQVTFGSFNNLSKVTPELIGYWARILTAIPSSRLIIKSKPLFDAGTRDYVYEQFKQHSIEAQRIELLGWLPDTSQHLTLYNQVDIALDTFPYNGTTTTCEALWMGVPIVTLAGQTHVSRVGVSLLWSVGLAELIAESSEEYIQKAVDLAHNLERLQELRATLRDRMAAAPLTNAQLITRSLENAYRTMWRHWCSKEESQRTQPQPDYAQAHFQLGNVLKIQGKLAEAIESYQQALNLKPDYAEALNNLGNAFYEQGKLAEAIASYRRALQLNSNHVEIYNNLGNALQEEGKLQEAVVSFQQALQLKPDYTDAHYNLANTLKNQGKLQESIACYQRAIQLNPNLEKTHNNLGNAWQDQGKSHEAIASYQQALQLNPNYKVAQDNLVFSLHYSSEYQPSEIYAEHRKWAECIALITEPIQPHSNERNRERRLRIGYVSGDFKTHSVSYFFEPLLAAHNHSEFDLICYANNKQTDATTARLRQLADGWREIYALNDEQVAQLIRQDKIDILVDLSGHTKGNRMLVFARKPAPIQATYLGYPNTTGLDQIDYRLVDVWSDPQGQTEHLHTEQLVRLPQGFLCYQPPVNSPQVSPPPFSRRGQITFGCFNHLAKVNPQLVSYWTQILQAVPNSRFLLKSEPLVDSGTRNYLQDLFQQQGIDAERLELMGWIPAQSEHLSLYSQVDIALDTFPYHGTTTTCEALWMGVPVITLAGQTHVSRVGVSLLHAVGLEEMIAQSPEAYIQKAVELANDQERLQALRVTLRDRMAAAPLTNAQLITQSLEEAYRTMWRQFCDQSPLEPDQRLVEIEGNIQICVKNDLNSLTTYILLEQGDWFEPEMAFVRRLITPGMQILDIGANHGVYTLTMAKLLQGQGQVTAYEPDRSVVQRLHKSLEVNALTTVEVVNAGLSDYEGEATLFLSTNSELNSLQHNDTHQRQETIQLLSLDRELARRGWQDISFIKLDAEGEEPKILAGGQRFFSEQSPLIMFELKHGKKINLPLIQLFQQLGYAIYRFVPGLGCLVPFDVNQPVDGYQLNLFACKADRAKQLVECDLLVAKVSEKPALPTPSSWLDGISALGYTAPFLNQWRALATTAEENTQTYLEGLSYFLLIKSKQVSCGERLASLQYSFECLQQAVRTKPSLTRLCSLARVAAELGKRQVSVEVLEKLYNALQASQTILIDEPFLPVNPQYDYQSLNDNWHDWLFGSILETYENSRAFSSYFSPQISVTLLNQVIQKPCHSDRAERRLQLAKKRLEAKQDAKLPNATKKATENMGSGSEFVYINDIFVPPVISIVDIGAMELSGSEDRFVRLSQQGLATIVGFEPLPEECAKLNAKAEGSRRYLPYAIADGSKRTLYVKNTGMTSSLLPPNQDLISLFVNLAELMQVVRTEEIVTKRLDDIPEIVEAGCDLLKVDVQGLEFEIFCNATTVLSNCLVVQTEVEFVPLYVNQPLFAEVDQVLRQNGFVFHKFLGLSGRPFKPIVQNGNPNARISQVLWSDAVYVRDFTQLHHLTPEKLLKLAAILHELYGSVDLCHHLLTVYDEKTGATLTSRYLERLVQKIENQTEKNQTNPAPIANQLDLGIKHHQSGQLSEAETCFQQVLKWQPDNSDAWHLLGVIAAQQQQYSKAIERIERAIALKPTEATFYDNLGNVYIEQEQFHLACESYKTVLQFQPNNTNTRKKLTIACEELLDLGIEHHQARRLAEAETCYQQVLQYQPNRADAWHLWGAIAYDRKEYETAIERINRAIELNSTAPSFYTHLGNIFQEQGKLEEAIQAHQKALLINPNLTEVHNNIGNALVDQGKLAEAIASYQRAIEINPDFAEAHGNLGNALINQGKVAEAIASYQRALQLKPDYADAYYNLGNIFKDQGNLPEAIASYQHAVQLNPNLAKAYNNLGNAWQGQGKLQEAIACYQRVLQLNPNLAKAHNNLGNAWQDQGKSQEAIASYQRAVDLNPNYAMAQDNLVFTLHYSSEYQPSQIYAEHQKWGDRIALLIKERIQPQNNDSPEETQRDRNPERRLRIGYVSGDFKSHSVSHFFEPLLAAHNQRDFEIICYANNKKADAKTEQLRQLADGWREIHSLTDEQAAEVICQDRIDIMVDLSGHTAGNRLLVFARKPAPIQVSYLGYPSTTGLNTIDYRLTDAWADPPGKTEHLHTEELVRLPHGFLCYQPPQECPSVSLLPALEKGQITFGSFNNLAKVNPQLVSYWAQILKAVPNSRLLLKSKPLVEPDTCHYLQGLFQQQGIGAERLELTGWISPQREHLSLYNQMDIALDTFPYHGTTTTCEAMWMGVPVITLAGQAHVSRVGVSLLSSVGLAELIAESPEEYIQKAIALANNLERLQQLRATLRDRMAAAPLTNAKLITQSLETVYRTFWQHWCQGNRE